MAIFYGRFKAEQVKIYPSANATDGGQFNKEEFISKLAKHATKTNHVIREGSDESEYFTLNQNKGLGDTVCTYITDPGLCIINGYLVEFDSLDRATHQIEVSQLTGSTGVAGLVLNYDAAHLKSDYEESGISYCGAIKFFIADSLSDLTGDDYLLLGNITNKSAAGVSQNSKKYIIYNFTENDIELHRIVLEDTPQAKVVIDDNPEDSDETIGMTVSYGTQGTNAKYGVFGTAMYSSDGSQSELLPGSLKVSTADKFIIEEPLCTKRSIRISSSAIRYAGYPSSIFIGSDGKYIVGLFSQTHRCYLGPISPNNDGTIVDGVCSVMVPLSSGESITLGDTLSPLEVYQGAPKGYRKTSSSDSIIAGIALEGASNVEGELQFTDLTAEDLGFKELTIPSDGTTTIVYEQTDRGVFFKGITTTSSTNVTYKRTQSFDKSDTGCAATGRNTDDSNFAVESFSNVTAAQAHTIGGVFTTKNDGLQEKTVEELPSGSYYVVLNGNSQRTASDGTGFYGLNTSDIVGHSRSITTIENELNIEIDKDFYDAAVRLGTAPNYSIFIFLDIAGISTSKLPGISFDSNRECSLTIQNGTSGKFNLTFNPQDRDQVYPVKMLIRNSVIPLYTGEVE